MDPQTAAVDEALGTDLGAFADRVAREVTALKAELEVGTFDNPRALVGFEYEFYGVDDGTDVLRRVPPRLLDLLGFEAELGAHNAEFTASPQPLGPHGLAAVRREVQAAVRTAVDAQRERIRLVSDGHWTVPPVGETGATYLTASEDHGGHQFATNLHDSPRYHAMSNSPYYRGAMTVDAPHASLRADTVAPSSMTATIQPHYQVPVAATLPTHFRYALRIAGPLLALAVNSPFYPPSCYDDGATAADVLADGWRENRVHVFESMMNDPDRMDKVRFPTDLGSTAEAVDRIACDPPLVPTLHGGAAAAPDSAGDMPDADATPGAADRPFPDRFAHLRHKHGSYWRWVRPVFGTPSPAAASTRIEFRPLPAQPTVRDSVAFLAAVGGALRGLVEHDHPVADLPWERARENFYAAARHGLDADLHWVTADGAATTDPDVLFRDLFDVTRAGLRAAGLDPDTAANYLRPLEHRVETGTTPAAWKRDRLRHHADAGADLETAVVRAKRDYLDQQRGTLVDGLFGDWEGV
jgi:hypothetical protein